MLEDLPGGLASLRAAVERFHKRGVRVLLSYNPWDQGTRWTRLRISAVKRYIGFPIGFHKHGEGLY